ncbi:MAG: hypothetical protein NTX70_06335, partial [Verrucomicrobia bacterium]|nr:hypothetical protein [Verrucomicrobiota bacterium]
RVYAAFLQNAPVVRHTRGFTPGWYAVPRWGTPNASPPQRPHRLHVPSAPAPHRPHAITKTPGQRRLFFLNGDHQTIPYWDMPPNPRSGSGIGPERA